MDHNAWAINRRGLIEETLKSVDSNHTEQEIFRVIPASLMQLANSGFATSVVRALRFDTRGGSNLEKHGSPLVIMEGFLELKENLIKLWRYTN